MKITVIGSGYVGLVVGSCLADTGNEVECVDIDQQKISQLSRGEVPFYEPGLTAVVQRNLTAGRLTFNSNTLEACQRGQVIFIAVGTPQGDDGSAELKYVYTVAESIGVALAQTSSGGQVEGLKLILIKSTVPIGTADEVNHRISLNAHHPFVVCSNPEFLKEGDALNDFLKPDRIILGVPDDERGGRAERVIRHLYSSFYRTRDRLQVMSIRSSEMTKYAANALLATKISFMNELALLAEDVGADIEKVRTGIGADPRIGYAFLFAGAGYGGSCFPKDVKALSHLAQQRGRPLEILEAVDRVNLRQKLVLLDRAIKHYGAPSKDSTEIRRDSDQLFKGMRFAVWGLSFKPRTDDMREAPSITLIEGLIERGAEVIAYDPEAQENAAHIFSGAIAEGRFRLSENHYACLDAADALFIVTEWRIFHHPDFDQLRASLKAPIIFDGRNLYDPEMMRELGFIYYGIGRGHSVRSVSTLSPRPLFDDA